ncbi:hypothetical protein K3495_g6171 [Podosphaera aphanis]|nr:hypothetical protein K3495_g6171 [Podosphaera aphanis]
MHLTLLRYAAQQKISQFQLHPYRSKTRWPPDFSKLDAKQQFRYERKFKRRTQLKWARPRWVKGVKIAQLSSILFVIVYGVLFMDLSNEGSPRHKPFAGIRSWFFGWTGDIFKRQNVEVDNSDQTKSTSSSSSSGQ